MASQDASLAETFRRAQREYRDIEDTVLAASDPTFQTQVQTCIQDMERCRRMVDQLHLFSVDETIDEVGTNNLKYVGQLIPKIVQAERRPLLQRAQECQERFYSLCQDYGILTKEDLVYYETVKAKTVLNPARNREEHIARYKRQKQMEAQMRELEELMTANQEAKSASAGLGGDDDDDDITREHALLLLRLRLQASLQSLRALHDEMELLARHEQERAALGTNDDRRPPGSSEAVTDSSTQLDMEAARARLANQSGPLLSSDGRINRPFVITDKRDEMRKGVFRPGWNLPTMSVDEYLEIEQQRGNIISGGGKEPEKKETEYDGDAEAQDRETMKQRDWDDFKDN
ncbi:Type 2A phosphatase-associated protein 42, partial [Tieghemiomyces parasiticus]